MRRINNEISKERRAREDELRKREEAADLDG